MSRNDGTAPTSIQVSGAEELGSGASNDVNRSQSRPPKPTADQLLIRDATPEDASTIAEIYNQSIRSGGACMEEDLYSTEDIQKKMDSFNGRETILVLQAATPLVGGAIIADEVLGWGIIKRYSERPGYRFTCETAVYLRRDLVGMGFGTRIKRAQMERCRQYRYHHMVAKILSTNTASIEYNKRLGYDVVGVQKEAGYQNGCWQDITIMQRVLDTPLPEDDRQDQDAGSIAPSFAPPLN